MVLTFAGVLIVAAKGDLGRLSSLAFDRGDVMVLVACLFYAFYTLGLRARPPGTPLVFFAGMAFAALLWSVPIAGYEIVAGQAYLAEPRGLADHALHRLSPRPSPGSSATCAAST